MDRPRSASRCPGACLGSRALILLALLVWFQQDATAWSAFVAGVLGGLLYAWLSRITSRPALTLWIVTLALATIDSILIITQPFPAGAGPLFGIPIWGLIVPLKQAEALLGIGHFTNEHFPARYLVSDTLLHYATAVAVSIVVPWWAGRKIR